MNFEEPIQLKITVIGEYFVGKTSVVARFVEGTFDDTYTATIGFSFLSKQVNFNGKQYILNVWDTSGAERHKAVSPNYFRGTDGCILIYDLSNKQTTNQLKYWYDEFVTQSSALDTEGNLKIPLILIGNKSDIPGTEETFAIAQKFADDNKIEHHLPVSALTGDNIESAFEEIVEMCANHQKESFDQIRITAPKSQRNSCFC